MKNTLLLCECSSSEHQIIIHEEIYNENDKEIYCSIHLSKQPFFKRLIYAIKYVFGYQSKFGAFEEFIFRTEHSKDLKRISKKLKQKSKVNV